MRVGIVGSRDTLDPINKALKLGKKVRSFGPYGVEQP